MDWLEGYLTNVASYPVKPSVRPGEVYRNIPGRAPENPELFSEILKDIDRIILPGITHWQHPNFHAYFPANSSVESLLAECITAGIGAQCMMWETSPAAAELEQRMMEWLRDAMGIPGDFEGVIQDSASSATLAAILTAREVCTEFRSNEEGIPSQLRVYCSTEAHSSVEKAVGIAGIGRRNLVKIPVDDQMRMQPALLEKQISEDLKKGRVPCAVVAAMGTTGTLAVDPLLETARICQHHNTWLHVDAAYAGAALLLEEYRWMSDGLGHADSFVFNPHKWLFTNFDCSAYYVKDPDRLIRTFEILPEYLRTGSRGDVNDYRDWGVPLGRRFRALKLWFVLRGFGLSGIRDRMRDHIRLSQYFTRELDHLDEIQWMTEPFLNVSCFRYHPRGMDNETELDRLNRKLHELLNQGGRIYLTHTRVHESYALRMVIGQTYVEKPHVDLAIREIKAAIEGLK